MRFELGTVDAMAVMVLMGVIAVIAILLIVIIGQRKGPKRGDEYSPEPPGEGVSRKPPGKSPLKPSGKPKEKETRVKTSLSSKAKKETTDKQLTPAEAEFAQLLVYKVGGVAPRTCWCCGAEVDRAADMCPACGQSQLMRGDA